MTRLCFEIKDRRISLAALKAQTDLSVPTLSNIVTGRMVPTDRELALLASALNIFPPSLLLRTVRIADDQPAQEVAHG